ncbi:MAG: phytoene desaturase family protein [Candidatus Hermodarchaeota archaeon]
MIEHYEFIVIGGGIAGLHIGALLSQHGKVLVLEKEKIIGGRAKVVEIGGFKLDYGPHPIRFGPKSPLGKSLIEIGKPIEFIKPGDFWALLDDGTKTIFPAGDAKAVKKSTMVPFMDTVNLILRIKMKMNDQDFEALYDTSLEDWIKQEQIIPKLQGYLIMTSSAVQVNPFPKRVSVGELLHTVRKILDIGSIFYPKGGWGEIFSRFSDKIKENGEIRLSSDVKQIIVENGKAKGVKIGNKVIKGEKIISTIPVQQLFTILDENLCDKDFVDKCKNLRPTAGISIDFCLDKPITDMDFFFLEKPLAFGFVPSNLSDEIVPKGKSLISFFSAKNREDIRDKNRAKELHRELRDSIIRFFPDIEQNTLHERPLFFEMVDGVEANIYQHRLKRPTNIIENIENFYLAGDSVGGGKGSSGGDIGHSSTRKCYKLVMKK